jgi:RimJ/RimL family protein N-acetyltransferase
MAASCQDRSSAEARAQRQMRALEARRCATLARMKLRNVRSDDVDAYVRMRCDPVMMADLGGPQSADDMVRKAARDAVEAEADREWILVILPDDSDASAVAGTVALWSDTQHEKAFSEIGWMVLPEFQGRGVAKAAVQQVIDRARADGRWGDVHAFPSIENGPSNAICRSTGFVLMGTEDTEFAGQTFRTNHWVVSTEQ